MKSKLPTQNHSTILILRQSRRHLAKDVHVAVVLYLLPNSNWPRVPCGIRNVSVVLNVGVHWIVLWLAMGQIRKSTADHAMLNFSDRKDSVTATALLWFQPVASQQFNSKRRLNLLINLKSLIFLRFLQP